MKDFRDSFRHPDSSPPSRNSLSTHGDDFIARLEKARAGDPTGIIRYDDIVVRCTPGTQTDQVKELTDELVALKFPMDVVFAVTVLNNPKSQRQGK